MPAQRAAQVVTVHDLVLSRRAGAHPGRDPPRLPRSGRVARTPGGCRRSPCPSPRRNRSERGSASTPDRIAICPTAHRPGPPAGLQSPRPHPVHRHARAPQERGDACSAPMPSSSPASPDAPPLVLAGATDAGAARSVLDDLAEPPLSGRVAPLGYVSGAERERLYRERVDARAAVVRRRLRPAGARSDDGRRARVCRRRGALPEVVGDAGVAGRSDDVAGLAAAMHRVLDEPGLARRLLAKRASFRPRRYQLGHERGALDRGLWSGSREAPIARVTRPLAHRHRRARAARRADRRRPLSRRAARALDGAARRRAPAFRALHARAAAPLVPGGHG